MASSAGRDLTALYLGMSVSRVGFGVIIVIFPLYIAHSTDLTVAFALALYPILEACASLPAGRLCDRAGRRRVLEGSLALMAVLMGAISLTRSIVVIAAIHALMGVSAAGVTVSTLAMITDLTAKRNRGAGMGTFDFANLGGYAVGLFLGGKLDYSFSKDLGVAFLVTAAVVASALIVALVLVKEPERPAASSGGTVNPLASLDPLGKAMLPIWLSVTTLVGIVFFLPRAFEAIGISGSTTANLLFLGVVVLGVGSVGFGALSDSIGRGNVIAIGAVGLLGLLASVGISFAEGVKGIARNFPVIGVFAILTSALIPTILATVGDNANAERRGEAMGVYSVMLSGGTAVGTLIAGYAHSIGGLEGIFYAGAFIFGGACAVSAALWIEASRKKTVNPI